MSAGAKNVASETELPAQPEQRDSGDPHVDAATEPAALTAPVAAAPGSGAMFDRIARRYDLLNRVMSFGVDRRWRRLTARALALPPQGRVLDVAAGTGDLALAVLAAHPGATVVGIDPSAGMLERAAAKAQRAGLHDQLDFQLGIAEALPFADGAFDAACIAFGIRNVPDRPRALAEMARVVRPGGRVAVLELSEPRRGLIGPLARFHIRVVVPRLGGLISGHREYRYLQRSIAAFPPAEEFCRIMEGAGMTAVQARPLTFGVCHLYVATVPAGAPR